MNASRSWSERSHWPNLPRLPSSGYRQMDLLRAAHVRSSYVSPPLRPSCSPRRMLLGLRAPQRCGSSAVPAGHRKASDLAGLGASVAATSSAAALPAGAVACGSIYAHRTRAHAGSARQSHRLRTICQARDAEQDEHRALDLKSCSLANQKAFTTSTRPW